jgi:sterol desaturase/sphingolipid hydroxylase (fatty acid hydroxylase superfamily)
LELIINLLATVPVTGLLGLRPDVLGIYLLLEMVVQTVSHANVRVPTGVDRLLRLLLVTPNMHSLHHSAMHSETDSNYGDVFTFWDRLFGTYREVSDQRYKEIIIGLNEVQDERASDFWWQMTSPLSLSLRRTKPSISKMAEDDRSERRLGGRRG